MKGMAEVYQTMSEMKSVSGLFALSFHMRPIRLQTKRMCELIDANYQGDHNPLQKNEIIPSPPWLEDFKKTWGHVAKLVPSKQRQKARGPFPV